MLRKKKLFFSVIALLILSLLFLTACGDTDDNGNDEDQAANGDADQDNDEPSEDARTEVVWGAVQDPDTLDPRLSTSAYSEEVSELIFNSLIYPDENLEMVFDLATDMETPDDNTYIFTLREDVYWHDGEKFTSEDVVFTFESILDEDFGSPHLSRTNFDAVEAIDEYTVQFTTEEPNAAAWTSMRRFIVPAHLAPRDGYEPDEGNFAFNPVGTGPFKLTEWTPNDQIVLERNEDYFEGPVQLERIIRREIPEEETRYTELLNGNIDIAATPEREMDTVEANDDLTLMISGTLNYFPIAINHGIDDSPLNDVRVRQALNYGIDKEAIVSHLWPTAEVMHNPIVPGTWAYDDDATYKYAFDQDKAMDLLDDAGYGDGLEVTITMSNAATNVELGEMLKSYYDQIGVTLEVNTMEFSSALDLILDGDFELYHMGSVGMYDPHDFMSRFINGDGVTSYDNPEFNQLVEDAVKIIDDQDARAELYSEAQQIMTEDAYNVPMYNSQAWMAWNSDFNFNYDYVIRSRAFKDAYWSN